MKLLLFSDVHYYGGDMETAIFSKTKKLVQYALPMVDALRETCAELHPDLCLHLGDLIQDTQTHDGDVQALTAMADRLRAFPVPCRSLLGNHDMKMMNSRREAEECLGDVFVNGSTDLCGWHLVFLNTGIRPEMGLGRGGILRSHEITEEDLAWLRRDLAENTLPTLVFSHYPLSEDGSVSDVCMFMKNRAAVKEILRQDSYVRAVFAGHQHRSKTIVEDGIPYFLLGSMIGSSQENGIPDGVYFEVETDAQNVRVTEKRMELN